MKISQVPIGLTVKCNGSTALIIKHGELGTRVRVLTIKENEFTGFVLGDQIWSGSSVVEYPINTQEGGKTELLPKTEGKAPLNLF